MTNDVKNVEAVAFLEANGFKYVKRPKAFVRKDNNCVTKIRFLSDKKVTIKYDTPDLDRGILGNYEFPSITPESLKLMFKELDEQLSSRLSKRKRSRGTKCRKTPWHMFVKYSSRKAVKMADLTGFYEHWQKTGEFVPELAPFKDAILKGMETEVDDDLKVPKELREKKTVPIVEPVPVIVNMIAPQAGAKVEEKGVPANTEPMPIEPPTVPVPMPTVAPTVPIPVEAPAVEPVELPPVEEPPVEQNLTLTIEPKVEEAVVEMAAPAPEPVPSPTNVLVEMKQGVEEMEKKEVVVEQTKEEVAKEFNVPVEAISDKDVEQALEQEKVLEAMDEKVAEVAPCGECDKKVEPVVEMAAPAPEPEKVPEVEPELPEPDDEVIKVNEEPVEVAAPDESGKEWTSIIPEEGSEAYFSAPKKAKDFGDDPKIRGPRDSSRFAKSEPWEVAHRYKKQMGLGHALFGADTTVSTVGEEVSKDAQKVEEKVEDIVDDIKESAEKAEEGVEKLFKNEEYGAGTPAWVTWAFGGALMLGPIVYAFWNSRKNKQQ